LGKETPIVPFDPIEGENESQPIRCEHWRPAMSAAKKQAVFRFYGSLTEFLPRAQQQADLRYAFWAGRR
jgi:hypothetical protein